MSEIKPNNSISFNEWLLQEINDVEKASLEKFKKHVAKHYKKDSWYGGAIGGVVTYMVTPASIGTVIELECVCGFKMDITDYDSW